MKRVNIYDDGMFVGWFNLDAAKCLAKYQYGNPYVSYQWLYLTAGGKLILEESNNSGQEESYRVVSARVAVELINDAGTNEGEKWASGKGADDFTAAEIK